jgi:hypothetical protein
MAAQNRLEDITAKREKHKTQSHNHMQKEYIVLPSPWLWQREERSASTSLEWSLGSQMAAQNRLEDIAAEREKYKTQPLNHVRKEYIVLPSLWVWQREKRSASTSLKWSLGSQMAAQNRSEDITAEREIYKKLSHKTMCKKKTLSYLHRGGK